MRAEFIQDDPDQGAIVRLIKEGADERFFAAGDGFSIGHATGSGADYLSSKGGKKWVETPERLEAKAVQIDEGTIDIHLQPAYVNCLEEGFYSVYILSPDGSAQEGFLEIDNVQYSTLPDVDTVKSVCDDAPQEQDAAPVINIEKAPVQAPRQEPVSEPAPQPAQDEQAAAEPAPQPEPEPEPEPTPDPSLQAPEPEPEGDGRLSMEGEGERRPKKTGLIVGVVAALLIAGAVGAWFALKPAEFPAGDAPRLVGEFFAAPTRTPEGAMELAAKLKTDTPARQDAVYRLFYYASEAGDSSAAVRRAECIDPSTPQWGTIEKDGAEAWEFYGYSVEGDAKRDALKAWTKKAAASGNARAIEWLRSMD